MDTNDEHDDENLSEESKYPYGSPSWEVPRLLDLNKYTDYSAGDISDLVQVVTLCSEILWTELRAIRDHLESNR